MSEKQKCADARNNRHGHDGAAFDADAVARKQEQQAPAGSGNHGGRSLKVLGMQDPRGAAAGGRKFFLLLGDSGMRAETRGEVSVKPPSP